MRHRRWSRSVRAVATVLAVLASVVGCASEPAAPWPPPTLRILLVNDDGWPAPGIILLRKALQRAGHHVVEVAPYQNGNFAGTGATLAGRIAVRRPTRDPDLWGVTGTPADAALVGIREIMANAPPDLVVSGVNPTYSLGVTALQSGTVGAAATSALLGVPSMAVSTKTVNPYRPRPEELAPAIDFTVRLVDRIARTPAGVPKLPDRTVLNVNYPGGTAKARGVAAAPTDDLPATRVIYRPDSGGRLRVINRPLPANQLDESDVAQLAGGNVTLTDLSADPDRANPPVRAAARLAPLMTP